MLRRLLSSMTVCAIVALPLLPVETAEAAHAQDISCTGVPDQGYVDYSAIVGCNLNIVRPAGDTGATYMQLGMHFPAQFPGISSWTAAGFNCTQDALNGHKRLSCFGTVPLGGITTVSWGMHVVGRCGEEYPINATIANVYGVNSTPVWYTIRMPSCPSTRVAQAQASSAIGQSVTQTQQQINQQIINQVNSINTNVHGDNNRVNVNADQQNNAGQGSLQNAEARARQRAIQERRDVRKNSQYLRDEYYPYNDAYRELSTIHYLPKTGPSDFFSPLEDTTSFLRPTASAGATPAIAVSALVAFLFTLGIRAVRSYFTF